MFPSTCDALHNFVEFRYIITAKIICLTCCYKDSVNKLFEIIFLSDASIKPPNGKNNESSSEKSSTQLTKPRPPPILPPKQRNEASPKIGDLIHHRLLPRENCVTNILYSRRLPSPPGTTIYCILAISNLTCVPL